MGIKATAEIKKRISVARVLPGVTIGGDYPYYMGPTEFEPSEEAQTIPTAMTLLASDITIAPIPSNYGKIVWDGITLSVI